MTLSTYRTCCSRIFFYFYLLEANLEINKEEFAADLVCLLEEGTPRNVAQLKAEIESYFVLGAARIDMIAKVMELDNSIGDTILISHFFIRLKWPLLSLANQKV